MKKHAQPIAIADGAYFIVDVAQFMAPVVLYDERLATQTITGSQGGAQPHEDDEDDDLLVPAILSTSVEA